MKFERLDNEEYCGEYVMRRVHVIKGVRGIELGEVVVFAVENYMDFGDDIESDWDRGIYCDRDQELYCVDMTLFLKAYEGVIVDLELENKDGEEWDTPAMRFDLDKVNGLCGYTFFK